MKTGIIKSFRFSIFLTSSIEHLNDAREVCKIIVFKNYEHFSDNIIEFKCHSFIQNECNLSLFLNKQRITHGK